MATTRRRASLVAEAGPSSPSTSTSPTLASPLAYTSMVDQDRLQAQRLLSTMALEEGPVRLQRARSLKKGSSDSSNGRAREVSRNKDVATTATPKLSDATRSRRTEMLKRPIVLPDPRQVASTSQQPSLPPQHHRIQSLSLASMDRNHSPILDGEVEGEEDILTANRGALWAYASDGCRQDSDARSRRTRQGRSRRPTTSSEGTRSCLDLDSHEGSSRRHSSHLLSGNSHDHERNEGRRASSSVSIPSLLRGPSRSSVASAMSSQHLAAMVSGSSASVPTAPSPNIASRSTAVTLYNLSRGRSTNVSPSRRWDRRGASASVLSGTDSAGDEDVVVRDLEPPAARRSRQLSAASEQVKRRAAKLAESRHSSSPTPQSSSSLNSTSSKTQWQTSRRTSAGSLDMALFSSEDGISSSSSSDDERHPASSSRRSSIDREKRRGLRVLLARSHERDDAESGVLGGRLLTGGEEIFSDGQKSLASSCSSSTTDFLEFGARRGVQISNKDEETSLRQRRQDMADDESDGTIGTSALLMRRRSRSGKRLLRSTLRSPTSPSRAAPRMSAITSGLTPATEDAQELTPLVSGFSDATTVDSSSRPPTTQLSRSQESAHSLVSMPVEQDADPLLSSDFGSVAELVNVDAVVWNDLSKRGSTATNLLSIAAQRDVDEQEKARRSGFAVAYQERLASLSTQLRIWSRPAATPVSPSEEIAEPMSNKKQAVECAAEQVPQPSSLQPQQQTEAAPAGESILSSSWRHLSRLPNLLQLPTLTSSSSSATKSATSTIQPDVRASSPSNASTASIRSNPSPLSSPGPSNRSLSDNTKGRGVMNPLEGDADVSAYVSGLGLPIDPDVELSSVVHLQTFRSRSKSVGPPKPSPLRRLETASEDDEAKAVADHRGRHRRTASDWEAPVNLRPLRSSERLSSANGSGGAAALSSKLAAAGRLSPPRCSRPAVQAPVPGNYSAYNSSASGSEESESDRSNASGKRSRRRSVDEEDKRSSRGRRSGTSSRRSSPPSNSRQCAIGLFSTDPVTRRRDDVGSQISDALSEGVQMIRVKSLPNLCGEGKEGPVPIHDAQGRNRSRASRRASSTRGRGQAASEEVDGQHTMTEVVESSGDTDERGRAASGTRGRMGSVKVVSASLGPSSYATREGAHGPALSSGSSAGNSGANPMGSSAMIMGSSGVGANAGVRPIMVSNGAHLLMLSLELEMMRSRKITGQLKPRWLKARARPERNAMAVTTTTAASASVNEEENSQTTTQQHSMMMVPGPSFCPSPTASHLQYLASRPRSGSNLRFELP